MAPISPRAAVARHAARLGAAQQAASASGGRPSILIVTVFTLALALRLAHLWSMRGSPIFETLLGDAHSYDTWGRQIAGGDIIGRDAFYQAPLYAYVLGAIYALHGSPFAVRVCQAIAGAAACVLLARATRRLFGEAAGWLAGLMLAFYAPAIFFDGLIQKSALDLFLLSLLLAILTRFIADAADSPDAERPLRGRWRWLAVGIVLGALGLTRENALLLVPVVLAWIWWGSSATRTTRLSAGAAVIVGASIVLFPVGVRNALVAGEFHLTTAQWGPNFYIGNHALADGTYVPLRAGRGSPEYERADATEIAARAAGRRLSPGEVSSYWTRLAFDFIRSHPTDWLRLETRKLRLFWNRTELVDTESQESHEDDSPVLRSVARVWHFGVLAPLACLGIWITWSRRRALWLLYAMAGAYILGVLAFYVVARYRLPIVPFLIIFAAAAAVRVRAFLATQIKTNVIAGSAALAGVVLWCNVPVVPADMMRAATSNNLGTALQEAGRLDEAAAAFERALALEPDYAPAHNGLGSLLRLRGRLDEAIDHFEQALRLRPEFEDANFNLANALAERGDWAGAIARYQAIVQRRPDAADVHANLGIALASANRLAEATGHLRIAAALAPETARAHYNLGHALLLEGDAIEAIGQLALAAQIDPRDVPAHYELGNAYLAGHRLKDAEREFRETVRLSPRFAEAHNNLGIVLGSLARLDEAVDEFTSALLINPGFDQAQANLRAARLARRPASATNAR